MSQYNLLNGYIGSKAPYVSKIKALFDKSCTKYVEPYCGGAGVYFSNYNGEYEKEWLNDCNQNIAIIYEALSNETTAADTMRELLAIKKPEGIAEAKKQFKEAKEKLLDPTIGKITKVDLKKYVDSGTAVEYARNAFLVYSQSFNCSAKSYSAHKTEERYRNEVRRNLQNVMERLETKPRITCVNGLAVIKHCRVQKEIQLFVDWPYVGLYRRHRQLYTSEMAGLHSHILGADALNGSESAVVMCGYRSPREGIPTIYDAILTGEDWHCFKIADTYSQCAFVKTGEKKDRVSEYVWTNRVPEHAGLYISMHDYKEKITYGEYWERIKEAGQDGLLTADEMLEYELAYRQSCNAGLFDPEAVGYALKKTKNRTEALNLRAMIKK